jgi:hypothetical protein
MELSTGAKSWQTRGMTLRERIEFRTILIPFMDCWLWDGRHDKDGYAQTSVGKKTKPAHRVVYEEFVGPIPEGKELDHICRQRGCVNPRHVEPVTTLVNQQRSPLTSSGRTDCIHGHGVLYRYPSGRRVCRTCQREGWKSRHKKISAKRAERRKQEAQSGAR